MRAFSFSDTCDPRTPPHCLNLQARGPWTVKYGSMWSIRCPDTRRSTTRWTREPWIWTDPPRSGQSGSRISMRSRAVKSTGPTLERQLTAAAGAAGGPIATAAGTGQLQEDHKTRARIDNIACYQWPKDRLTRLGSPRYRVKPPSFEANRPESADRAPRADLRGLGPCF